MEDPSTLVTDNLPQRLKEELAFHNRYRDPARVGKDPIDKYYDTTNRLQNHGRDWICRHAPGSVFLDYACGDGATARFAAQSGAKLAIGVDISDVSVENARRLAATDGLTNTRFDHANAEDTGLPDNSVDAVICCGVLHHLDLARALPELRRVMKPGGRLLAVEALAYNPAIRIFRALTPSMRTAWEKDHILGLRELAFARQFFDVENVRYWHVVGYLGAIAPALRPMLERIDVVLEKMPAIRLMAWQWTFELVKPHD
jgi:SAM-dependent methyltransferase